MLACAQAGPRAARAQVVSPKCGKFLVWRAPTASKPNLLSWLLLPPTTSPINSPLILQSARPSPASPPDWTGLEWNGLPRPLRSLAISPSLQASPPPPVFHMSPSPSANDSSSSSSPAPTSSSSSAASSSPSHDNPPANLSTHSLDAIGKDVLQRAKISRVRLPPTPPPLSSSNLPFR